MSKSLIIQVCSYSMYNPGQNPEPSIKVRIRILFIFATCKILFCANFTPQNDCCCYIENPSSGGGGNTFCKTKGIKITFIKPPHNKIVADIFETTEYDLLQTNFKAPEGCLKKSLFLTHVHCTVSISVKICTLVSARVKVT